MILLAAVTLAGCAIGPPMPDRQRAADSHAGAGLQLLARDRPGQARERLERALEIEPGHAQALTGMGLIAEAQGERDAALRYHRQAVDAAPDSGPVLNNWGRILCREERVDKALEVLHRAAEAEGYQAPEVPLSNAARCALEAGRAEQARSAVAAALEAAPEFPPARTVRAELHYEEEAYEAAAEDLRRAREGGETARNLYWSARVAGARENPGKATAYAETLLERFPDSEFAERLHADEVVP
ncbi:MAG: tetratricopeptide repeat protein [Halorhodospira sp.]